MTKNEIKEILRKHELWIGDEEDGEHADFSGYDLSGADLNGVDLRGALFDGAKMDDDLKKMLEKRNDKR